MSWNLDRLTQETRRAPQRPVYPYVVASLRRDPGGRFEQHGSGPNFQGGVITLCTCKHELRSRKVFRHPAGVWVAGLSPATGTPRRRYLFYLMLVGPRADSQSEMWELLEADAREAKNARRHRLGDLYQPRRSGLTGAHRFDSDNYFPPRPDHSHACGRVDEWRDDIEVSYHGRHPVLLAGDPAYTFMWPYPTVWLDEATGPLPRNPAHLDTLDAFIAKLRSDEPLQSRLEAARANDPDLQRRVLERRARRLAERGWPTAPTPAAVEPDASFATGGAG